MIAVIYKFYDVCYPLGFYLYELRVHLMAPTLSSPANPSNSGIGVRIIFPSPNILLNIALVQLEFSSC